MTNQGFSLVELIVTLAIIAIMTAIATSSFKQYTAKTNLRAAAREIAADFTYYRNKAKSESRVYTITFNTPLSTNNYTISAPAAGVLGAFNLIKTPTATAAGIAITGVDFTGCSTVGLSQRGLLNHCAVPPSPQNNTGTITLTNERGANAVVNVTTLVKTYVTYP